MPIWNFIFAVSDHNLGSGVFYRSGRLLELNSPSLVRFWRIGTELWPPKIELNDKQSNDY